MRILLLTAAFFVITICVAQVTPPYSTSFEGAEGTLNDNFPDGWTWEDLNTEPFSNQSWQIIKNTASVTNARTDSTAAHMFSHSSETNNDWLYTPGVQLAVTNGTSPANTTLVVGTGIVEPRAVTVDDFNGDGFLDVVASSETLVGGATRVVAYFADPANLGTWLPGVDISTTIAQPYFVESGDLDDDGDLDVVVGSATSGALTVFVNSAGTFTAVSVPLPLAAINALNVDDYDLDGDLDFAAASRARDTIAWWESRGSGIWIRHDVVTDFDGASSVVAGDIDGDGDPDFVASALEAARLTWWRSHYVSDVGFASVSIDRAFSGAEDTVLADLDDDGDLDFVGSANGDGFVTAWINVNGAGTILNEIPVDVAFALATKLAVADLDADGDLDIVGISANDIIRWWSNDDGLGRAWTIHSIETLTDDAIDLDVGDLDGDADVDVAVLAEGSVRVFRNDGAGTFVGSNGPTLTVGKSIAVADIDGDTNRDLVVAEGATNEVLLFVGVGDGTTFTSAALGGAGIGLTGIVAVGVHDFDRDQRLDILALGSGGIRVIRNGTGGFTARSVVVGFPGARSIVAGDVDADGDLDIFVTSLTGDTIRWFESTSLDATVWVPHVVAVGATVNGPTGIDVGDVDGDGDLDIATALRDGSDLVWWRSDGTTWWNP